MSSLNKPLSIVLATVFTLVFSLQTKADRHSNFGVRYDQVVSHSQDLQYIAEDLRDCFRADFRRSRVYGKLVAKTNRIRNRARSLNRHGVSRGNCKWQNEIRQLDEFVFGLRDLVNEAVQRSRIGYDQALCPNAVRKVYRLIGKAEWHVNGLKQALYQVNRPIFQQDINPRIYNQPVCPSGPSNGFGVYRNLDNFNDQVIRNRNSVFPTSTRHRSQLNFGSNGVGLNLGGFRVSLNN